MGHIHLLSSTEAGWGIRRWRWKSVCAAKPPECRSSGEALTKGFLGVPYGFPSLPPFALVTCRTPVSPSRFQERWGNKGGVNPIVKMITIDQPYESLWR
ncbi:hypothetical protein AVEN_29180-1 [Araneus ventricosus]|uniref:Uncharacterized protein n=1 Tax=Araneus ventricosus TaxID=182803 RepID=A0A4Y2AKN1_ARAVE|nr:hypothetical protein AVEN_29180-1 [Araneus ventricosus]